MNNLQHCRLTTLITPLVYPLVEVTIFMEKKENVYKLKATIGKNEEIYLELKAELIEVIKEIKFKSRKNKATRRFKNSIYTFAWDRKYTCAKNFKRNWI